MTDERIRRRPDGTIEGIYRPTALDWRWFQHDQTGTPLGLTFDLWQTARGGAYWHRPIRDFEDLKPPPHEIAFEMVMEIVSGSTVDTATLMVEEENPLDFVAHMPGKGNIMLRDMEDELIKYAYAIDILMVKMKQHPTYTQIYELSDNSASHYYRLLLPVQDRGKVTKIHAIMRNVERTVETRSLENALQG